jgi:hypothetical protein
VRTCDERPWALPRALSAACLVVTLLAGCSTEVPGEVVGAYTIQMRLTDNNCGAGVVPSAQTYAAELRAGETPRGFWRVPKQAPIEGRYEAGEFQFTFSMSLELGDADAGTTGCTAIREELLQGQVTLPKPDAGVGDSGANDAASTPAVRDAGSVEEGLTGTHRISFRTNPQGRCAKQPGPLAVFEHLPCSALYVLQGTPRKPF